RQAGQQGAPTGVRAVEQARDLIDGRHDPVEVGAVAGATQQGHGRRALLASLAETLILYALAGQTAERQADLGDPRASALCALVETAYPEPLSIGDCARALDLSATHLTRLSRRHLGVAPGELILRRRMLEARRLLRETRQSVAQIGQLCGYRDPAYFVRVFTRSHGLPPGRYRKERADPTP
ncbi:MAG: helix-turn-helix transcriptional regulator, partial [Pseudomonadota bacterium]